MYGIDFGTSNTVVCFYDGTKNRLLRIGNSDTLIPTLLFLNREGHSSIGVRAINLPSTHRVCAFRSSSISVLFFPGTINAIIISSSSSY